MKITAQMSMVISAIFAVICFGVAINGFGSLGAVFGAVGYWIVKTGTEEG